MKEIGKMIRLTDSELIFMLTELNMKEAGKMTFKKDKG